MGAFAVTGMLSYAPTVLAVGAFFALCAALSVVDARTRTIPNRLVGALAALALLQMLLDDVLGVACCSFLATPLERVLWCVGTFSALLLGELAWRRMQDGSHGMGLGDVKLLAAFALWFAGGVVVVLLSACLLAVGWSAVRRRRTFPFGPFLSVCACLVLALLMAS